MFLFAMRLEVIEPRPLLLCFLTALSFAIIVPIPLIIWRNVMTFFLVTGQIVLGREAIRYMFAVFLVTTMRLGVPVIVLPVGPQRISEFLQNVPLTHLCSDRVLEK